MRTIFAQRIPSTICTSTCRTYSTVHLLLCPIYLVLTAKNGRRRQDIVCLYSDEYSTLLHRQSHAMGKLELNTACTIFLRPWWPPIVWYMKDKREQDPTIWLLVDRKYHCTRTIRFVKRILQARQVPYLPRDVGFPAPPSLTQVLKDGLGLVLLDALWHHVQNVVHHLNKTSKSVKSKYYYCTTYHMSEFNSKYDQKKSFATHNCKQIKKERKKARGWAPKRLPVTMPSHNSETMSHGQTYSSAQLQVKVTLHTLLSHCLGHTLAVPTFKLTREQIAQPSLQQGHDATKKEYPNTPTSRPHSTARTLAHRTLANKVNEEIRTRRKGECQWLRLTSPTNQTL